MRLHVGEPAGEDSGNRPIPAPLRDRVVHDVQQVALARRVIEILDVGRISFERITAGFVDQPDTPANTVGIAVTGPIVLRCPSAGAAFSQDQSPVPPLAM